MNYRVHHGDALARLREMPEASIHCCVTSPPYYGLRDYGVEGQIGLESTPEEFIGRLVSVFREVRRVLVDDGTCWVNMGDSYAGSWGSQGRQGHGAVAGRSAVAARQIAAAAKKANRTGSIPQDSGLKPKDLMGMPWALAFALRADGWYLRQDVIWHKPNPMPESVRDRCTKAHEYVFLLAKSARYFYDVDAIREPAKADHPAGNKSHKGATAYANGATEHRTKQGLVAYAQRSKADPLQGSHGTMGHDGNGMRMPEKWNNHAGRNKRSVWTIATQPTPEAHFATFPLALAETCILAGCPEGGTVLDPFAGAGTTGLAAVKHGRRFVGIELNAEYIRIAEKRLAERMPLLCEVPE